MRQKYLQTEINNFLEEKKLLTQLELNESINSRQSSQAVILLQKEILGKSEKVKEMIKELKQLK